MVEGEITLDLENILKNDYNCVTYENCKTKQKQYLEENFSFKWAYKKWITKSM